MKADICNEFKAVIRCMRESFCRPGYQKFLMCLLIKRLGQAFVLKHAAKPLKRSAELLKRSTACLYYNTAHAVTVSHGNIMLTSCSYIDKYHKILNIYISFTQPQFTFTLHNQSLVLTMFYLCFNCVLKMKPDRF